MGEIAVGTASWTDRTLIESGWYPPGVDTAEKRLAHYARQFPLVASRRGRPPPSHPFNIKAFSLLTGHPTRVAALYRDRRPTTDKTLDLLRQHDLPYVCVEMPQGHRSSVPPVLAATADLAVVRFHGHSDRWTSRDIQEKFGYRYSDRELAQWVPRLIHPSWVRTPHPGSGEHHSWVVKHGHGQQRHRGRG